MGYLEELKLGVEGHDQEANEARHAAAIAQMEAFNVRSDEAYAKAKWPHEPHIVSPFGVELLVQHKGDLERVASDEGFRSAVDERLEFGAPVPGVDPYVEDVITDVTRSLRVEIDAQSRSLPGAHEVGEVEVGPGREKLLKWAQRKHPLEYEAYHETLRHVGGEEERSAILEKLEADVNWAAQNAWETARAQENGIRVMMEIGRPDLVEVAERVGFEPTIDAAAVTDELVVRLESYDEARRRYEETDLKAPDVKLIELWDDESSSHYWRPAVEYEYERADHSLAQALADVREAAYQRNLPSPLEHVMEEHAADMREEMEAAQAAGLVEIVRTDEDQQQVSEVKTQTHHGFGY